MEDVSEVLLDLYTFTNTIKVF